MRIGTQSTTEISFTFPLPFPLAAAFVFGLCLGPTYGASANILIDDFTQTGDASLYPIVDPIELPTLFDFTADAFGTIEGIPAVRILNHAPMITAAQVASGLYEGDMTLDLQTDPGVFTSTSNGDALAFLQLGWVHADPSDRFNLDVTSEQGVLIDYESNLSVVGDLNLGNFGPGPSNAFVSTNSATIEFQPGRHQLFIPFEQINEVITQFDFQAVPPGIVELPDVDLTTLDSVGLTFNATSDDIPLNLVFSLHSISLTSEPSLTADFNGDGTVDLVDLDILGANWLSGSATNATGDANGDGTVDLVDLDLLGQQWEMSASFASASASVFADNGIAVPEPTTIALGIAGLGVAMRRRRLS